MHVCAIRGVAAKGGDGSHDNGEVVTAVVDEVDDNLKAACTQVKDEVHALQIYTQEHATVDTGSPIDDDDRVLTEFSMRELIDAPMRAVIDDLVVTVVCLDDCHTVRGYGMPTLVRSAITGAGTALWLMHPDVDERRLRVLRMPTRSQGTN